MATGDITRAYLRQAKLAAVAKHIEACQRTALLNIGFFPQEVDFLFSIDGRQVFRQAKEANDRAIEIALAGMGTRK